MEAMSLAEKDLVVAGACFGTGEMKVGVASGAAGPGCEGCGTGDNRMEGRADELVIDASSLITAGAPRRGTPREVIGPLPTRKVKLSVG